MGAFRGRALGVFLLFFLFVIVLLGAVYASDTTFFQTNIFQPQNPSKLGTEIGLPGLKMVDFFI